MLDKEKIKQAVFDSIKQIDIKPKEAFTAFYQILTGKPFGLKAADLVLELTINKVIKIINEKTSKRSENSHR